MTGEVTDPGGGFSGLPLEGIRVVDLTVVWSGPGATMLLGDLGAEVIRAECLTRDSRMAPTTLTKEQAEKSGYAGAAYPGWDPGARPYNRNASANWHARNKLSITLPPLQAPEGREAFLRLIEASDVFVENNAPATLSKLSLDYDDLRERNEKLIMVRMPPMGLSGPASDYIGYGPNFNALVGIAAMDGYEGEPPTSAGENYHMDEGAAAGVAMAVMAGLWRREDTGEGCLIEFPQSESLLAEMGEAIMDLQMNGRVPATWGNSHPALLQDVFATADEDRWLALTIRNDADWAAFVAVAGGELEEYASAGREARVAAEGEIRGAIRRWAASQEIEGLVEKLIAADVPAAEVMTELGVLADPHLHERGWFKKGYHPETGLHMYPGHAWRMSAVDLAWGRPFPALGEDNEYVYREVMGYSEAEYEAGQAAGYIGAERPR